MLLRGGDGEGISRLAASMPEQLDKEIKMFMPEILGCKVVKGVGLDWKE